MASAYLFYKLFPEAEFYPGMYGESPPSEVSGRDLVFVDFSYPKETLLKLKNSSNSIVVLEHHKTAQEQLQGLDFAEFNMNRCGTTMARWYLQLPDHWFMDYIEDRDLWKLELPQTELFNATISSFPTNGPADWEPLGNKSFGDILRDGEPIQRYRRRQIDLHKKASHKMLLDGEEVPVANCTNKDILSEVAGELSQDHKYAACYYISDGKHILWSIRSRKDSVDVSKVARKFKGGGHRSAAAFRRTLQQDPVNGIFSQNQ